MQPSVHTLHRTPGPLHLHSVRAKWHRILTVESSRYGWSVYGIAEANLFDSISHVERDLGRPAWCHTHLHDHALPYSPRSFSAARSAAATEFVSPYTQVGLEAGHGCGVAEPYRAMTTYTSPECNGTPAAE